ncbi:MAG: bifunctional DNA primase/polymerase [Rhizomicrobium sp.]
MQPTHDIESEQPQRNDWRAPDAFAVATMLASLGYRVLPTRPENKVPFISRWPERATTHPHVIARWRLKYPGANWSIFTGEENDVEIIDVDGEQGRADLARLESELGPLPQTWSVVSGRVGGGTHRLFKPPPGCEDLRTVAHVLGCAIDIRGWHGHAVLPGSLHKSGNRYQWALGCAPDECELAELPPAWRERLPKHVDRKEAGDARDRPRRESRAARQRAPLYDSGSMILGDGAGGGGFHRVINRLSIFYFKNEGADADPDALRDYLRRKIEAADASNHSQDAIQRYMSDAYLGEAIESAREFVRKEM